MRERTQNTSIKSDRGTTPENLKREIWNIIQRVFMLRKESKKP